jgi:integrase
MLNIRHGINPRDARYKYVFPTSRRSSKKKHIQDPRKTFKLICADAKIPLKCIHFLRHTWATFYYEVTGDIYAVKEAGGWKDIKSLLPYVKLVDRRKNKHAENVDKYMNSHGR